MEAIDSSYWKSCIEHMKKEAINYLVQDGVIEKAETRKNRQLHEIPEVKRGRLVPHHENCT